MPDTRTRGATHGSIHMPFTAEDIAALRVALGIDTQPVVQAAPAAPRIASPFTTGPAAVAASPASEARSLYPNDVASQRAHIAGTMAPRYTCSVDTTATLADGSVVPSALHGFTTAKESGIACPGIRGIAKGEACPGTIR